MTQTIVPSGDVATTVSVDDFTTNYVESCYSAEWKVVVRNGDGDMWSGTVSAIFDRGAMTPAIDWNIASIMTIGNALAGLDVYPEVTETLLKLIVKTTDQTIAYVTRSLNCLYDIDS
jgi:hypothetical protein